MTCNNFDTNLIVSPYFTWFPDWPFDKLSVSGGKNQGEWGTRTVQLL
ncbi:hypothetical protein C8R21_11185 [Nitrosospira multiformis]|uniref:Uncharacterized protein n=1 Tax=Nitrosospira multiformis TaxID=1231 RepID=A0A1I7G1Y9_9PROT|nr:hypothetical protein [Nitrosospira multiformis]PTQ81208.1 hypothetical protein C8R21_11185 [Nitrosospira multiformis]SFU42484.1 hypothetical protein SAMN05216417_10386 [Nitrosospira multiformis]